MFLFLGRILKENQLIGPDNNNIVSKENCIDVVACNIKYTKSKKKFSKRKNSVSVTNPQSGYSSILVSILNLMQSFFGIIFFSLF